MAILDTERVTLQDRLSKKQMQGSSHIWWKSVPFASRKEEGADGMPVCSEVSPKFLNFDGSWDVLRHEFNHCWW